MSIAEPELTKVFAAGVEARALGRQRTDNPYSIHSELHDEWSAGWGATCDLDEEDDPLSCRVREQDDVVAEI